MRDVPSPRRRQKESGFALLVLMGLIGVGSVGMLIAVKNMMPDRRERAKDAYESLELTAKAARYAYRRGGTFADSLDNLASQTGLPVDGRWSRDAHDLGQPIRYRVVDQVLQVGSRGPDKEWGTADDVKLSVAMETQRRVKQRLRLRVLP